MQPTASPPAPDAPATAVDTGLTTAEVEDRVLRGDVNDVPVRPGRTVRQIVRDNTLTRFNALLGSLLAVILVVGPLQDALFGLVLVSNTLIGIVQELRAKRALDQLALLAEVSPRARRDGREVELHKSQVVRGDVLLLAAGEQVVVDGTVVEAVGLDVDESLLTGEADPVDKAAGDEVLSGSFVAAGSGAYQATRVGRAAYAAQLAEQARAFTLAHSELRAGIDRILRVMTYVMVPVGALLLGSQLISSHRLHDALRGTVAGLVTMVPEGLVLLTSLAFAVGVLRLGRRHVLVQELAAIEGLARVDVVCLDKTGTLTEPGMRVSAVETLDHDGPVAAVLAVLAAADPQPNPTLRAVRTAYPKPPAEPQVRSVVPFSSARKWSGVGTDGGGWVLGAPEVLMDAPPPRVRELATRGLRVLLLARTDLPLTADHAPAAVRPVALVVLEQPVRPDAAATLSYFAEQGVAVKVISGDDPATVGSISAGLGVPGAGEPVDARQLPERPDELAEVLESRSVFGRVTPRQKQEMVAALRSRGHVVAMTGDGVNDVLALKEADVGMAMGNGSEASRAVARLVLLDSRFAVVPAIVGEGRRVLGNIERVATLFLTKTVYATVLALAVVVARLPFPFLPRHLTLVGSLTIGVPGFFLALRPNLQRARSGFVPRVLRRAVPAGAVAAVASFTAYGLALRRDDPVELARTVATLVLALVALRVLLHAAQPLTWPAVLLVATMGAAFAVVVAVPGLREFFALVPLAGPQVLLVALTSGAAVAVLGLGWRVNERPHPGGGIRPALGGSRGERARGA